MARRKKDRIGVAWHLGAHLSGVLVIALAFLPAQIIVRALQALVFVYFVVCCLDVVVTKYQLWHFEPLVPEPDHYALITGASSGIGREMAYLLAEKKFSVLLVARSEAVLERMKAEMQVVNKIQVEICVCDLSTTSGVQKLVDFIAAKKLVVDILINNAGASVTSEFHRLQPSQVDQLLQLDVNAVVKLTHAILPQMMERKRGHILNISSLAAATPNPFAAMYAASKAFVFSFSQAINYEVRSSGVTVTCFCPGPVATNFGKAANCEQAIYLNLPGATVHAKDCAQSALNAMFNADECAYDTFLTRFLSFTLRSVVPTRLGLLVSSVCMHTPSKALNMMRR